MKCPYCGKDNTRVIDSRPADDGDSIRRRRECDVCGKRFTTAVDEIEANIFNKEEREISSREIGEMVMEKLKNLDSVAYVRFASVYREFKDVNTFMNELKKILE